MAVTRDKLASLLVFAIVAVAASMALRSWGLPGFGLFAGLTISLFGLVLIWFAEPLSEIGCFSRGIAVHSPPLMIEAFGWIFLVGYPALLACVMP